MPAGSGASTASPGKLELNFNNSPGSSIAACKVDKQAFGDGVWKNSKATGHLFPTKAHTTTILTGGNPSLSLVRSRLPGSESVCPELNGLRLR